MALSASYGSAHPLHLIPFVRTDFWWFSLGSSCSRGSQRVWLLVHLPGGVFGGGGAF